MAFVTPQWEYDKSVEESDDAQACQKSGGGGDTTVNYLNQTKTLEINPHNPLIKDLIRRINDSKDDDTAFDFAYVMAGIAALPLGHGLQNSADFANRMESVLGRAMNVLLDKQVEDVPPDDDNENLIDDNIVTP